MIHHYGANKVEGREVEITSPKVKIDRGEGGRGGKGRRCPKINIHLYWRSLDWLLRYLILTKQVIKLFVNLPVALLSVRGH